MTVQEILEELEAALKGAGFESPELEAAIIAGDSLGLPHLELSALSKSHASAVDEAKIREALKRRLDHEPLQYIFGEAFFRHLKLKVGPGCLIPRPETELLAEIVMEALPQGGSVCELGAGSGAISLAFATERPDLKVYASEISPEAYKWAERNRVALGVPNFELRAGDLLSPFKGLRFDAIVANLPYIPAGELASLEPQVRLREPVLALDGGPDGLAVIRRALAQAPAYMKPGALLALEIAETQGESLLELISRDSNFKSPSIRKDLCGKDRFVLALSASC